MRNLERQPDHAFWLPTAKFYPNFVAKLHDRRILVIEYKGAHLANEDSREKENIGKVWAKKSGNRFLMAWKADEYSAANPGHFGVKRFAQTQG